MNTYFVSLGCPKNLVDSQVMLGKLTQGIFPLVQDPAEAELIIVNTCSFIQSAKEESVQTILDMAEFKSKGKCKTLVVSGCLAQRYADELSKEMPEIDVMVGTGQYHRILDAIEERRQQQRLGGKLPPRRYIDQPAFIHAETDQRVHTGARHLGYLKIAEGCNRNCAFCIIPKLRGHVRSRSIDSLVAEAEQMVAQGVKELCLVAQDLTEYGIENKYKERIEDLLLKLCKIEGLEWIRLHYDYPDEFSDELIEIIAQQPKIVKYLDMPIQHTSDRVLQSMNRRLKREKLFTLVRELRERIPGITFRTSMIVGFPGETEADFELLCKDMETLMLDHVGVFTYSQEEGTRAARLDNQVSAKVKRERQKKLLAILKRNASTLAEMKVGRRWDARIETQSSETEHLISARLATQAEGIDGNVLINDLGPLEKWEPGMRVEVEITQAMLPDYIGRVVRRG